MLLLDKSKFDETISIMRGSKKLPDIYLELKEIIKSQYGVNAINFIFEKIKYNNPENRYCLNILLLNRGDYQKMCANKFGYDKEKQQFISDNFYKLALRHDYDSKQHINNVWVYYTDFDKELKDEINQIASKEAIAHIKANYQLLPIWMICPQFTSAYIFLETDVQVEKFANNEMNSKIKQEYYSILKKYDEFNNYDYDSFSVYLDSKEHLDKDYDGNLFYYFK